MESTFDVFLTGEILPGYERGDAVSQLARVFKLDLALADQLVNGQKRRVKAGCNKAAALQFRQILSASGLQVAVQRVQEQQPPSAPVILETSSSALPEPHDPAIFQSQPTSNQSVVREIATKAVDASATVDYRPVLKQGNVDTIDGNVPDGKLETEVPRKVELIGKLEMAAVGELILEPRPDAPPPATSLNFDLAPAGAPIPNLKRDLELLNPNVDHLKLVEGDGD